MKKFLFVISTLSTILVVSCKNSSKKSSSNTGELDPIVSDVLQEASEDDFLQEASEEALVNDDIMAFGTTYVTSGSSKAADLMGGQVNLTMEMTIYGDGSADGQLIETNDASSYLNENSYTHTVEGVWEEVSKKNKRYVMITFALEDSSQDYYKEFVYYIDEDLNAYADNINTHPIKLIEKSLSDSKSTYDSVSEYYGKDVDGSIERFEYSSFINASNEYKLFGEYSKFHPDEYCHLVIFSRKGLENCCRIPAEEIINWTKGLTGMKELFVKNDKIAKDNGVTTDITKDITEFSFGFLDPKYSSRGADVCYKYIGGISSMELRVGAPGLNPFVWIFNNVQDFDSIIDAFDWTKFNDAVEKHKMEYQKQKEAENKAREKAEAERALFD